MRRLIAPVMLLVLGTFVGCEREQQGEPALTPASRISGSGDRQIEAIASSRCEREQRCNRISSKGQFATREHCLNAMRTDTENALDKCRVGFDNYEVQQCLNAINSESCESSAGRLQSISACRARHLCLEAETPWE